MSLETFLYLAPLLLVSLVLHELAHALVATRLGDPTPREQGRLTLNPLPHLDPLGTTMFVLTAFVSSFIFGWARPVIVQPRYFRRPQLDMALVALAGPATNFLLALACAALPRARGPDRPYVRSGRPRLRGEHRPGHLQPHSHPTLWTARASPERSCRRASTRAGRRSTRSAYWPSSGSSSSSTTSSGTSSGRSSTAPPK